MPVKEEAPWGLLEFGPLVNHGPKRRYYGAVYYSQPYRAYGWVGNCYDKDTACNQAGYACQEGCGNKSAHGKVIYWARNSWLALAIADNGSCGAAHSTVRKMKGAEAAQRAALAACTGPNPVIVLFFDTSLNNRGGRIDPRAPRIPTDDERFAAWAQDYARKARARGYTGPIKSGKRCMWCGNPACPGDSAHPGATL